MHRFNEFGNLSSVKFLRYSFCELLEKVFRTLIVVAHFSSTEVFKFQKNEHYIPEAATGGVL